MDNRDYSPSALAADTRVSVQLLNLPLFMWIFVEMSVSRFPGKIRINRKVLR